MALIDNKITTYATSIAALTDTPNNDGLTADQLKALFDGRTDAEVKASINGIIDALSATTDGTSGADQIGATTIGSLGGTTVQAIIEALNTTLTGTGGANYVGASSIAGLTGTTVQALLTALKTYIDTYNTNHKLAASTDHDNRYYTETEVDGLTSTLQGNLNTHKTSNDHDGRYYTEAEIDAKVSALDGVDATNASSLSTHKTSADHDGRYFTEAELSAVDGVGGSALIGTATVDGVSGATVKAQLASLKALIDQVVSAGVADGSITNNKLSSDVKVGSLSTLATTAKTSVTAAINEVNTNLADLAGTGRTTETVKGNAEDLAAYMAESATQIIGTTRDMTIPGQQIVSGFNFKPKNIFIEVAVAGTKKRSSGYCSDFLQRVIASKGSDANWQTFHGFSIWILDTGADYMTGTITINNDNTITIDWVKTGLGATSTATITIIAFGR